MSSIFDNVTVQQFKDYFFRDFPFLPVYNSSIVYKKDAVVYDVITDKFYRSLIDNNSAALSDTTAWKTIDDDKYNYVWDEDIVKAMSQAKINANRNFGATESDCICIYLHLVAFYLVVDLKNASSGVNSSYTGIMSSKSVGNVSVGYAIPSFIQNMPMYALYSQNGYGLKYMSLIAPYLAVTVRFSPGASTCG